MAEDSGSETCSEDFGNYEDDQRKNASGDKVEDEEKNNQDRSSPDMFEDYISQPEENSVKIIGEFNRESEKYLSRADVNKREEEELFKKIELWRRPSNFYKTPSAATITSSSPSRGMKRKAEELEENSESLLSGTDQEEGDDWKRKKAWREADNYEDNDEKDAVDYSQHMIEEESPTIEEEDTAYHLITDLIDDNISEKDVAILFAKGYSTIESFLFEPKQKLLQIPGLNESKIDRMMKCGTEKTGLAGFTSASDYFARQKEIICITTGSKAVNRILGGGIETGSVTEVYGLSGSGKTQLCHMLAITCQLPVEQGGGDGKCIFIDSEASFRTERLVAIANRFKLDENTAMDNILHARSYNTDHQDKLVQMAAAYMTESRFAVLIVDSATALYRTDYDGRKELQARQIHLCNFLRTLLRLADVFGVAVVVTNQMRANMDGSSVFGDANVPIGGDIMGHAVSTRLSIRRSRGSTRICRITASPSQPESEVVFDITENGIDDVHD